MAESGLSSPAGCAQLDAVSVGEPVAMDGQQWRLAVVTFLNSDTNIKISDKASELGWSNGRRSSETMVANIAFAQNSNFNYYSHPAGTVLRISA